jgi:two-component system cell cycle response regulator
MFIYQDESYMKKKQTVHILDSLVEMTRYRDCKFMAKSLVKTLHELLEAKKIELYAIQNVNEPVVLSLLARIDSSGLSTKLKGSSEELPEEVSQAIVQCIKKQEIVILDLPAAKDKKDKQVIFPILDKEGKIVSLLINHCTENNLEQQRLTEGILRLYHNYLSLLEESQRDPLTGLLNRETFINEITKIISSPSKETSEELYPQSRRRKYSEKFYTYWLGLLDIDHFKHINDRYGHLYGDEVLILLVRLMQATFRKEDLLFRYGGEEFIVVLKVPNKDGAAAALERLHKTVAAYQFPQVGQVTVSIGYVQITGNVFPLTVVSRADKALYYAKKHGRNRLISYENLVAQGELTNHEKDEEKGEGFEFF